MLLLRQSRPISHVPTPQDDDEKSMSSGDESDSADLTDTDDSDDDELGRFYIAIYKN